MIDVTPPSLRQRLLAAATAWSASTGRSLGALSAMVVNSGKALDDLTSGKVATITDATLERFARYLIDPSHWPAGQIAEAARGLAAAVGVLPPGEVSMDAPDQSRVVLCAVCERRLDDPAAAACTAIDCPRMRDAA